jgi:hypothetical protein
VPLTASLGSESGQEALSLAPATRELLGRSHTYALRLRPGDDTSCLNLYRPQAPGILGAPAELIERGGFAWARTLASTDVERQNPWLLLRRSFPDGALPCVGDANTVTWILHSGLGQDITLADERGGDVKLRFVGLLAHSIFQGEVIIGEERFLELFPGVVGERYFLFEAALNDVALLTQGLEADLAGHGFDVETTGEVLSGYQAVENTYLSTFQILGGLGLLLGTLGLGAVLLRNVNERRGELALLRAVGYSRGALAWMVLSETAFLLVLGLLLGAGAAVVAVLPQALSGVTLVSWSGLGATLALVFAAGVASSALALRAALRAPLIPALRRE